ncbi:MAG: TonB-dependent receptor [Bacteroidales bacterium]|nr:TonB-dependent receptor [Bacteroidales bacterium]
MANSAVTFSQEEDLYASPDTLLTKTLGEVVVTAGRYPAVALKTPDPVRVLGEETFKREQIRSSAEAVSLTPGVFVQKTNHGGGSPFLRGLTGNQTLLLIDGIRLNNAAFRYGPNQYFNTIDLFSIEKIEVLRGSGSVQYGSDAIGGTIQAFTPGLMTSADPEWTGSAFLRAGSGKMEQSVHGHALFKGKSVAFRGGITYRNFGDLVGGDTTGVQTPSGYDEFDFDIKGLVKTSERSDITFAFQSVNQDNVPVYHKVVLENYEINRMDPQERDLAYLRYNNKINKGIFESFTSTVSFHRSEEGRQLKKNGSSTLRSEEDIIGSYGFSAEIMTSVKNSWSATSGIEVYHDLVSSTRTDTDLGSGSSTEKRGLYPDGSTMTSMALFSLHGFDFEKWSLTAGARFNAFIINVPDKDLGEARLTPSALVGNAAIMRKLNERSNLFVSVNTGFRAPNIDDLGTLGIVDFRYEIPNYDLKPENSVQYQFGYKLRTKRLSGEAYIYRNDLYNLIVRNSVPGETIEGYPVYTKENVERVYINGFETAWDYDPGRSWLVSGSLTYTYGQNITKEEPARRIPPLFGRLAATWSDKNMHGTLEWQAAGKQDRLAAGDIADNRIPEGGTPGWNVLNIHAGYTFRFVSLDLSLINLLDEDYRYHGSGINGYGRSAFLTLTFKI